MLSNLIKLIFYLSSFSPVGLVFSFVMYQQQNYTCALRALALSFVFIVIGYIIVFDGKNNCIKYSIKVTDIQDESKALFAYVLTYILPFVTLVVKSITINNAMLFGFIVVIMIVIYFTNMRFINPLLFIIGYKFYSISIDNGINSLLISRKKYRNTADISKATRLFEGIYIV